MTVCVGLLHKEFALLASDSRATFEDGRYVDTIPKILEIPNGGTLAIAGTLGAGQKVARLLGQHVNPLDIPTNEIPEDPPHFLFVTKDRRMFEVDSAFGIREITEGDYITIGSGQDVAQCSIMKQLRKRAVNSLAYRELSKIVHEAIEDACKLNLFCGGEIVIKAYKRGNK